MKLKPTNDICEFAGGKPPKFADLGYASEKEFFLDYLAMLDDMGGVGRNGYTNEHLAIGLSYREYMEQLKQRCVSGWNGSSPKRMDLDQCPAKVQILPFVPKQV